MKKNGELTQSDQEASERPSEFFQGVHTKEEELPVNESLRTEHVKDAQLTEANIDLDEAAVRKALQRLNENKSQGPVPMRVSFLRVSSFELKSFSL